MSLNFEEVRQHLDEFQFEELFIDVLGWSRPSGKTKGTVEADGIEVAIRTIAQLGGVPVIEVSAGDGTIPNADRKRAIHREIAKLHHENLLIFVDDKRTRSEWYWVRREDGKESPRSHEYLKGQPGDLFLQRVAPLLFEISDFENGAPTVVEVARRLKHGLDVEKVTKKFYNEFYELHLEFIEQIQGIDDERDRKWYASVLLNRLMFIFFLQRKGFIDGGDLDYLENKLKESKERGGDLYFSEFLKLLFFEGFARPESERSAEARERLGTIRYLNGGLFLPHAIEKNYSDIEVPGVAFENLFKLFRRYNWNLDDTPGGNPNEINPDVLGYILEKYINQKAFGAYYTRTEITSYLCKRTIERLLLDAVNTTEEDRKIDPRGKVYEFRSLGELLLNLDANICRKLLRHTLPRLSILDPACGSGAFLVAAMKTLIEVYWAVIGYARFRDHGDLHRQVEQIEREHPSIEYFIKKSIITSNLYGVDIMEEAVEIARLRLFLALVASARTIDQLEPLPNIDFNLLPGNSLIGLMRVDEEKFNEQAKLFQKSYRQVVDEKNRRVKTYRDTATFHDDLRGLRDGIERLRSEAAETLDDILLDQFRALKIKYEQASWDHKKKRQGKGKKRSLTVDDIRDLQPFHWGYEFDEIVNQRGGFDAILTNPPWESVEPSAKEFFSDHSDLVTKNKMDIKEFEKELGRLLKDPELMDSWLEYLSRYSYQRSYFRSAAEYERQIPIVNGRRQGKDINLYKLFLERCVSLLRDGGECGIVIPSGIYTDLGAKGLRDLLFETTEITGLFGFENRKQIFEGVDSRFKFVTLTFRKGGSTESFPAAFMRHDVQELSSFPGDQAVRITVDLVRKLSPDSMSISEIGSPLDIQISEKLIRFPLLNKTIEGSWNINLHREFNTNDDSYLFKKERKPGMLPLYEGRMIHQFDSYYSEPRFYVNEREGRNALLKGASDHEQVLEYQTHRLAYRDVARSTDTRTMIATVLPREVFTVETFRISGSLSPREALYVVSVFNSFVFDWLIRQRVSAHVSSFYVYQMPVPRMLDGDAIFEELVKRSARLIATRDEMDLLRTEAGVAGAGEMTSVERTAVRAEIDAIVAHLYGIDRVELLHILDAFPLVAKEEKDAVLRAFGDWVPADESPLLRLVERGESSRLEFKSSARWDLKQSSVNKDLEKVIAKTVAALMNSEGGTLLIGVADDGSILGLEHDYKTLGKKQNADAFENWLVTRLLDLLGPDRGRLFLVSFLKIEGKEVCRVDVRATSDAVFLSGDKGLYVRAGNSTRELGGAAMLRYCRDHFSEREKVGKSAVENGPDESAELRDLIRGSGSPLTAARRYADEVRRLKREGKWGTAIGVAQPPELSAASREFGKSLIDFEAFLDRQPGDRKMLSEWREVRRTFEEIETELRKGPTDEEVTSDIRYEAMEAFLEGAVPRPGNGKSQTEPARDSESDPGIKSPASDQQDLLQPKRPDDYELEDLLGIIRDVVSGSEAITREEAIREIASRIGASRVGSRVRAQIETALNTAARRSIIYSDANGLRPFCRTINDYSRDDLKNVLRSVIGRAWTDEDDAIRAAARHLGFRRTGSQIKKSFKSAIRGALRQGQFERSGSSLRGN